MGSKSSKCHTGLKTVIPLDKHVPRVEYTSWVKCAFGKEWAYLSVPTREAVLSTILYPLSWKGDRQRKKRGQARCWCWGLTRVCSLRTSSNGLTPLQCTQAMSIISIRDPFVSYITERSPTQLHDHRLCLPHLQAFWKGHQRPSWGKLRWFWTFWNAHLPCSECSVIDLKCELYIGESLD